MAGYQGLFGDFVRIPEHYWLNNQRQLTKFLKRKKKILTHFGWDEGDFLHHIIQVAEWRVSKGLLTYYLPSIGSSGSHLLQHIFSESLVACPLGEVYLSPRLVEKIKLLPMHDRKVFLEAYHLGHATNSQSLFKPSIIINTVHNPTLKYFSQWTNNYRSILIVRRPVDVAISRTFRKDEYRDYLNMSLVGDETYLKDNIDKTAQFYKAASKFNFDAIIRFEDIINNPDKTAEVIYSFMGKNNTLTVDQLEKVIRSVNAKGWKTNKYTGNREEISEHHIAMAKKQLKKTAKDLGY